MRVLKAFDRLWRRWLCWTTVVVTLTAGILASARHSHLLAVATWIGVGFALLVTLAYALAIAVIVANNRRRHITTNREALD